MIIINAEANEREDLINLLKHNVMSVTFTKKDGTERIMKCTLIEDYIIKYEGTTERPITKKYDPDMLTVWDIESVGFRKISIPSITKRTIIEI